MEKTFPLFEKLATRKLSPKGMLAFWLSMGAYCEASRHMGTLISSLNSLGHADAAKQISDIERSEQHHGVTLAIAALGCVKASGGTSEAEKLAQDRKKATRIFASLEKLDDPLAQKTIALAQSCVDLFQARTRCTPEQATYFLGVTYGVERLANTNIIPGEINAFIRSGLYDLTLDQLEMGYLREHAEECDGAEGWHEASMKRIIEEIGDTSSQKGVRDIEQATSDWYKDLYKLIIAA